MKAALICIAVLLGSLTNVEASGRCAGGVCSVAKAKVVNRVKSRRTPVRNLLRR